MYSVQFMLFDLDGTLIDSRADLARSVNLMLADLGRPQLSEATVASFVGDGVPTLTRRSLIATSPTGEPPDAQLHQRAIKGLLAHYKNQMFISTALYPRVKETLAHFKEKRKAIVTSKESQFVTPLLKHLGIAADFDCIVGGDSVSARKPDPAPVLEAVKLLGGTIEQSVMIGDSESDILAGRNARMLTCGVSIGFRTHEQLKAYSPDILIERFDQLTEVFF
ncbi:MAG: HAD-IA family hydrolase [Acidobacteriota bacterium]